ncbi:MAG: aminotransferase class III-fold pyridoxal phosphate-dependent enzyme, partial [Promethearchaeota archaeon]
VTTALAQAFGEGQGLQTGFTERLQVEVAETLCRQTGAERVRFTTSGTLATMYAILLARAFTGREWVLKVGGGWHGAQPWGLKGVRFHGADGYGLVETPGLPPSCDAQVLVTRFNDPDALCSAFQRHGDGIACFIVEPFVGGGGLIPATGEYLHTARQLTEEYGVVLIFDEVISGFRFHAGAVGSLYGIQADLMALGKAIGGGMPLAAVAGRGAILDQAGRGARNKVGRGARPKVGREARPQVWFNGGTYSGHPACLLAAKAMLTYLVEHQDRVYPRLAELGQQARLAVERALAEEGIYARCTGYPNDVLPGSSLAQVNFPYDEGHELLHPEDVNDPTRCDVVLRDSVFRLAMLLEDVNVAHGLGALSTAHHGREVDLLAEACRRAGRRIKGYL